MNFCVFVKEYGVLAVVLMLVVAAVAHKQGVYLASFYITALSLLLIVVFVFGFVGDSRSSKKCRRCGYVLDGLLAQNAGSRMAVVWGRNFCHCVLLVNLSRFLL